MQNFGILRIIFRNFSFSLRKKKDICFTEQKKSLRDHENAKKEPALATPHWVQQVVAKILNNIVCHEWRLLGSNGAWISVLSCPASSPEALFCPSQSFATAFWAPWSLGSGLFESVLSWFSIDGAWMKFWLAWSSLDRLHGPPFRVGSPEKRTEMNWKKGANAKKVERKNSHLHISIHSCKFVNFSLFSPAALLYWFVIIIELIIGNRSKIWSRPIWPMLRPPRKSRWVPGSKHRWVWPSHARGV